MRKQLINTEEILRGIKNPEDASYFEMYCSLVREVKDFDENTIADRFQELKKNGQGTVSLTSDYITYMLPQLIKISKHEYIMSRGKIEPKWLFTGAKVCLINSINAYDADSEVSFVDQSIEYVKKHIKEFYMQADIR